MNVAANTFPKPVEYEASFTDVRLRQSLAPSLTHSDIYRTQKKMNSANSIFNYWRMQLPIHT